MLAFPNIDPVIVQIGPLAITWYSLSYVTGVMVGWYYVLKIIDAHSLKISRKNIDDFISWAILGIIIGGRLGHVFFYEPAKYFSDPISILKTYEGGMSFHGGVCGFVGATLIFCRKNKLIFLELLDVCSMVGPIGLFLGRIANFINAELYGRVGDVPWAFIFPYSDMLPRHPSQLYEAFLEGIVLLFIQRYAGKLGALKHHGMLSGIFLIFYSCFRIIVEFFREPDFKIGYFANYFTMGQLLCVPMIIIGAALIFYSKKSIWLSMQK